MTSGKNIVARGAGPTSGLALAVNETGRARSGTSLHRFCDRLDFMIGVD
jgi:hypothetical protein